MKYLVLALLAVSTTAFADICIESKIIELQFNADAYSEVELKALAGELEVSASENQEITFWGKVCTA